MKHTANVQGRQRPALQFLPTAMKALKKPVAPAIVLLFAVFAASCTGPSGDGAAEPGSQLLQGYLAVKAALVNTDGPAAQKAALELDELLGGLPTDYAREKLMAATGAIAATADVETQRASFQQLSESLYEVLTDYGSPQKVYKQFCPMAFGFKGAYWLNDKPLIENPYFGDKMLRCGEVKETLGK